MINLIKKDINLQRVSQYSILWPFIILLLLITVSCKRQRITYTPKGYDITKPEKTDLGSKLREISGIFWVNDRVMLANNDEAGKIFFINLNDKSDFSYPNMVFGEKNDYEDIVKVDSTAYLLISTGQIVAVRGFARGGERPGTLVAALAGTGNEFETMYYDSAANSLVMLCKSCHKEKNQMRKAYRFDLTSQQLADSPYYRIDINEIRRLLKDSRAEFYPSAAAINPVQNKLYIVSSIGKLLVVTDRMGKVESAIPLSPSMFPQPEGITFAANGDMFISNEGQDDRATLLKFRYKP
ncbi:MAG TPA: hypothetical protein VLJ68_08755 [Chitinophagaceae bacterium]|nr:hypothetical protein [Chitinophagaceae bacterium]